MNELVLVEKNNILGEIEALEILDSLKELDIDDQIFFFFFFMKNSWIFDKQDSLFNGKTDFDQLILKSKRSVFRVLRLHHISDDTVNKILEIWNKYIKNNEGTCSNYFGCINVILIKNYLETDPKNNIKKEAKLILDGEALNEDYYIDLVCENNTYQVFECKYRIMSQIDDIKRLIKKLKNLVIKLNKCDYKGDCLLGTIDFLPKENITIEIDGVLNEDKIINGEDIFGISIT